MRNQSWKNKKSMTKWILKIQKYQCRSDKRLQGTDSTNVKVFVCGVILVRIFPAFSLIRTKYGEILCISPYSVRMRESTEQKKSKYGHFSRSDIQELLKKRFSKLVVQKSRILPHSEF